MSTSSSNITRRAALRCLAYGSAGTLFTLAGGVLTPISLAAAAQRGADDPAATGIPLFVQISDTHIGFNKDANPDVGATLQRSIDLIKALPQRPALAIHTGDITHLSKPAEFDLAQQLLSQLPMSELHTVPGEHDVTDPTISEYFSRFGKDSRGKGYYSFDHSGVHFVGLLNVLDFKPGGLGRLGEEQLAWLTQDLAARGASTPIVVFAHMPLWNIHAPWGWGTEEAPQIAALLRRFGSVTVLNGHIHQIVQKVEGNITYHTARSTAYPQPAAGTAAGPGPLQVPADQRAGMLGVSIINRPRMQATRLAITDRTLAEVGSPARFTIRDSMFTPQAVTVHAGMEVTWVNEDEEPHTVVSDSGLFRSGALDTHERFTFRFERPGTYRFLCSIHPQMLGSIIVSA